MRCPNRIQQREDKNPLFADKKGGRKKLSTEKKEEVHPER